MSNKILDELFKNRKKIDLTNKKKKDKEDLLLKKNSTPNYRAVARLKTLFSHNKNVYPDEQSYQKWLNFAVSIESLKYLNIPLLYEVFKFIDDNGKIEINESNFGLIRQATNVAVNNNKSLPSKNFSKIEKDLSVERMQVGFIRYLLLVYTYM